MSRFLKRALLAVPLIAAALVVGCGSDSSSDSEAGDTGLTATKSYLTDHSSDLVANAAKIKAASDAYYDLAKASDFDYAKMLKENCEAVDSTLTDAKDAYIASNPNYEEMEGIVAGIPRTAQYDTDIDAGSDASDPESAVSFNLTLPNGKVLKQPGNLFLLLETGLYGTDADFTVKGVKPDVNCDGKVEFGEGLPDANIFKATADEMARQTTDLNADAQEIVINDSDALTAITVMTPTMSEYFEQWKNSSFVAGQGNQTQQAFVATSRLSDIADILTGINVTYDEIEPMIAEENPDQAEQTSAELKDLLKRAEDLRDREAAGEKFTPEQADQLGAQMQAQAEKIAGQVTQAAKDTGVEIQEG
ncbi:MAG: EfeM/EfeO family lipoprotein [Thermoleophilia bacterium]|nr:EfeM/EfeO family lipoprotein [Thermoleophilia bacterium]